MIYWLTREDYASTVQQLCHGLGTADKVICPLSYEQVLYTRQAPRGHYLFTDFDRLSPYEVECAIALTDAIRAVSPNSIILNDPRQVLERVPLLTKLHRMGLNRFSVTRLDTGERPERYPVFVRCEDESRGAETPLLHSPEELEAALLALQQQGRVLKRRIAVEFCAQTDSAGWYRKYGVLNIGGAIIPQHILRNRDWHVKQQGSEYDEAFAEEELDFFLKNPHQEQVRELFRIAKIDFGRIDYTLVDGALQTFEINTNPTFPRFDGKTDARTKRRELVRQQVIEALTVIDHDQLPGRPFSFELPEPCLQRPRFPRKGTVLSRIKCIVQRNLP
ncbi:MAG: hypothetical protein EHM79_14985 [Geobacter sp.]|nr:MAG: hypothetical protein EHM79_14985 [Geobacter sp.]